MLSAMTHERENRESFATDLGFGRVRRLLAMAGAGVVLCALAAPAGAQVTRSFVGTTNTLWNVPGNWSPAGVPSIVDRVRFNQGGGERWVHVPGIEAVVRTIQVAPVGGNFAEYRFDLGEGSLTASSVNGPSTLVGLGGAQTMSSLAIQDGDLNGGRVWVSVLGPGRMRIDSGEAGFGRLIADEVEIGGFYAGDMAVDGALDVNFGRLTGRVVLAHGQLVVANGGQMTVDGAVLVGIDGLGASRPATFNVREFSSAIVGSMRIGDDATVSTQVLVLDPSLRGLTPALSVVGDFDISSTSALEISDAFIQREGATLTMSKFAGLTPFGLIGGTAELAGTFILTFAPGFDPPLDTEYPLLAAGKGVSGRWTVSYLPGLTGGRFLTIDYPPRAGESVVILGVDDLDQILDFDDPEDGVTIPSGPTAAVMGDFNNDGRPDVAISFSDPDDPLTAPGSVAILLNSGVDESGWLGFESQILVTIIADPRSIDVADFDGDGNLDVVVAGFTPGAVQVIQNLGGGSFTPLAPVALLSGPVDIKTADFNGDGRKDAVVALPDIESTLILTNELRAFGLIPGVPEPAGLMVDAVDPFDPDQDKDSDVGGSGGSSSRTVTGSAFVQRNNGEGELGTAALTQVGDQPVDIASGDLNLDSSPELVTVDFASDTVSVLVNDGLGNFAQAFSLPVGGEPRSITINDLDGDGDLDIAIVADTETGRGLQLLRNDTVTVGDLVFAPVADVPAGPDPSIVLSADLNSDDRVDLVAINPTGPRGIEGGQVTVLLSKSSPRCAADFTHNGVVNAADLNAFLAAWYADLENGTFVTDFNRDNVVNSSDVGEFINAYLSTPPACLD